jgi:uncharacterized protein with HEPN domain
MARSSVDCRRRVPVQRIDPDTVWSIVRADVPPLHAALEAMLDERYRDAPAKGN